MVGKCWSLAFVAVIVLAGCHRDTAASAGAPDPAGVKRAEAFLATFRDKPKFDPPADPFDVRACARGKTMLSIPISSANPFVQGIIDRMILAGSKIGLKVVEWQNSGKPSEWAQGVDHAINAKMDIVDLMSGIDPNIIDPQITMAKAAGVKVMTSHFYDPLQRQNPALSSSLTISFNTAGRVLADWAVVRTNGAARILVVKSDVPPTIPFVAGIHEELAKNCRGCVIIDEVSVTASEWSTRIQASVQSALLSHPDINIILPLYDSMTQFVVPAVHLAGRENRLAIGTFNGTPFVLDSISRGEVAMDVGESLDWIAYATLDGHLRDACGLKSPSTLNVPFYLFDSSNVADAGVPATYDKGYGDAYVSGFHTLWELN